MSRDSLDAVALWIVAAGVAHVLTSAEPLTALCGRDRWHKAAVYHPMTTGRNVREPRRICAECRRRFDANPRLRPRLNDIQPVAARQLALPGDWRDEP